MSISFKKSKTGRLTRKNYDPNLLMQDLLNTVTEVYHNTHKINLTALELSLPPNKVKKLLITAKILTYPETEKIQMLRANGKTMEEIQTATGLSRASLNNYLPYSKIVYNMSEVSLNAERVGKYRMRKAAVEKLAAESTEENLWNCIIAFRGYTFRTVSGLPFTYSLKTGRNGEYTRELFIDRRENSKSLSWSSVRIAFERVTEKAGEKAVEKQDVVFDRPKAIGDIRGISYIYSLLWRFGVICVPEEAEKKMRGT